MGLFTPNTDSFNNYYDKARFLLAWRISAAFLTAFAIIVPIFSLTSMKAVIPGSLALLIAGASLIYLHFTKNFKPLFWVYAICGTFLVHLAINYVLEFPHYVDFLWMVAVIFTAYVGLGRKIGLFFLLINLVGSAFFFCCTLNNHIVTIQPRTNIDLVGDFVEVLLAFFVIGYLIYQYIHFNEYSQNELNKLNKELESQNAENKTLLKEVHHRVKNNLQIITSLLRLQKGDLSPEVEKKFDEAINRIMTMSLIHQKLYQEEELSKLDLKEYTEELCVEIGNVFSTNTAVEIHTESDIKNIGLKTIVPCGLLLNELVSNSFKHAFIGKERGKIKISINQESGQVFRLEYDDDGDWKDPANESSFGLELIQILTDQMEGSFERNGSKYTFHLLDLDV